MTIRSNLLILSLLISTGCLGAGYILAGTWLIVPAFLLMALFWIMTRKRSVFWRASSLLCAAVALAAVGIAMGYALHLMIIACTAALISWDLAQFNQHILENPPGSFNAALENHHLRSLALAASAGLLLSWISSTLHLKIPFGVIVFLVLITVGSLMVGIQTILKKHL